MRLLALFFLLVLLSPLTPSSSWFWFSLPLVSQGIFLICALILGLLFTKTVRPVFFLLLLLFLLIKVGSTYMHNVSSFQVCLRLHSPKEQCTPFLTKNLRIDNKVYSIDYFGKTFPLYGFNQLEFNMLGEDAHQRPQLPFSLTVTIPNDTKYRVEAYPEVIWLTQNKFIYESKNDMYNNRLHVIPVSTNKFEQAAFVVNILATSVIVVLALLVNIPLIITFIKSEKSWLYLPLLVSSLRGTLLPIDILMPVYFIFTKNRNHWYAISACLLIFTYVFTTRSGCYHCQNILPSGGDPLTYESFSRDIVIHGKFWSAGEQNALFYYTPLYRYFLAIFHTLGGESLWPVRFFSNLIYVGTIYLVTKVFLRFFSLRVVLLSLLFLGGLNKLPQLGLYFVFQEFYGESIALPLLIFTFYVLLKEKKELWQVALSGLSLGLAIGIRPNYLFALLPPLCLFIYQKRRALANILVFLLGLASPICFIVIRNLIVVGKASFFNTSGASTLAIGLVNLFYSHQRVEDPQSIYFALVRQAFKDPASVFVPIWNNFRIIIGLPSVLPQTLSFLPFYRPIPNAFIYLPVWILGSIGLLIELIMRPNRFLLVLYSSFFLLLLSNLPFGMYFNGSAKYYMYVLLLTPFAIKIALKALEQIVGYLRYHTYR